MSLFGTRPPSLPQSDEDSTSRSASLLPARAAYRFDRCDGLPRAASFPLSESLSPGFLARMAETRAALWRNHAERKPWKTSTRATEATGLVGTITAGLDRISEAVETARDRLIGTAPATQAQSIHELMNLYSTIAPGPAAAWWSEDWYFAWQRLAGSGPTAIRRVDRLPGHFPLTEAHYARAVSGDSLRAAIAEGRLFLCDYAILDGIQTGKHGDLTRIGAAPIAAFAFVAGASHPLVPIAIQCGQAPEPDVPILTPADGPAWARAKLIVQMADANVQTLVSHWAGCHLLMESVALCLARSLSERHPIHRLLAPHVQFTLAAQDGWRSAALGPGSWTESLFAGTLEANVHLIGKGYDSISVRDLHFERDLAERGVDDPTGLPTYPFRDDGLLVWRAVHGWVDAFVRLYYADDGDVAKDAEIQAFVAALRDPEEAGLAGVPDVDTVAELSDLVASLVFRASAGHAALNYAAPDSLGFPACAPTALFAPEGADPNDLLAMLPPLDVANDVLTMTHLSSIRDNRLGDYSVGRFADERVEPVLTAFQHELVLAEETIGIRNGTRPVPYRVLRPSALPASVHA